MQLIFQLMKYLDSLINKEPIKPLMGATTVIAHKGKGSSSNLIKPVKNPIIKK
jgi:hypothetical protein